MSSSKPLGEILVEKGYITQQQLDAALSVQGNDQVGQLLISWNFITQEQLLNALNIQAPPPPPPPVQPVYQQPIAPPQQSIGGPDLIMSNLQKSKFNIDLKTLIYLGSLIVTALTGYFTFMSELDSRFNALEGQDKDLMVNIDKRLTELENRFTPIGDGVYSVDPKGTWPPSRGEYKMKDEMSRAKIVELEKEITRILKDIEKLEKKVYNGSNH